MALQALTQTKNLQLAEIAEDARANSSGLRTPATTCLLSAEEAFFWCAYPFPQLFCHKTLARRRFKSRKIPLQQMSCRGVCVTAPSRMWDALLV